MLHKDLKNHRYQNFYLQISSGKKPKVLWTENERQEVVQLVEFFPNYDNIAIVKEIRENTLLSSRRSDNALYAEINKIRRLQKTRILTAPLEEKVNEHVGFSLPALDKQQESSISLNADNNGESLNKRKGERPSLRELLYPQPTLSRTLTQESLLNSASVNTRQQSLKRKREERPSLRDLLYPQQPTQTKAPKKTEKRKSKRTCYPFENKELTNAIKQGKKIISVQKECN